MGCDDNGTESPHRGGQRGYAGPALGDFSEPTQVIDGDLAGEPEDKEVTLLTARFQPLAEHQAGPAGPLGPVPQVPLAVVVGDGNAGQSSVLSRGEQAVDGQPAVSGADGGVDVEVDEHVSRRLLSVARAGGEQPVGGVVVEVATHLFRRGEVVEGHVVLAHCQIHHRERVFPVKGGVGAEDQLLRMEVA